MLYHSKNKNISKCPKCILVTKKRIEQTAVLIVLLFVFMSRKTYAYERLQETKQPIVIVIDPGHGGENLGTIENGFTEKDMTIVTALSMYEELLTYDNVSVYLTRTEDKEMTLKERAEFAKTVNADFLFSIHYNASANHTYFGSEVWIQSILPYQAYGYQFAYNHLENMKELGLFIRGIKVRLNNKGLDYYGILRESVNQEIPAVIIEHCHVDEKKDTVFCDTNDKLIQFGLEDAKSVAQYFGLQKKDGSLDYRECTSELVYVDENKKILSSYFDETAPDICQIEALQTDYEGLEITCLVNATDYDSPLMYYSYSLDNGNHYSEMFPWPESDLLTNQCKDTITIKIPVENKSKPVLKLRVFNKYDVMAESNTIKFSQIFEMPAEETYESPSASYEDRNNDLLILENEEGKLPVSAPDKNVGIFITFMILCGIIVTILFVTVIIYILLSQSKRKK